MSEYVDPNLRASIAALAALTERGIPPDVQELLVHGAPERGIAPGALSKALRAALEAFTEGTEAAADEIIRLRAQNEQYDDALKKAHDEIDRLTGYTAATSGE